MRLEQKIKIMEREVGHVPMVCIKSDCEYKYFNIHKSSYCNEEIPYVKRINDNIHILTICTLKVEGYFKR